MDANKPPLLVQNISGVAARGATLLATAFGATVGSSVALTAVLTGPWYPAATAYQLAASLISSATRVILTVSTCPSRESGIFRSDNGGANWTNISSGDPTLNGIITKDTQQREMAVASNGRLYVVVVQRRRAQYIGFSDNSAAKLCLDRHGSTAYSEPNGEIEGIHPGGQESFILRLRSIERPEYSICVRRSSGLSISQLHRGA